ncbi:hypothetical protein SUGI_0726250 [Cryptomeria japonica]|nr:hypothetical protein SUGI_0726250 [Cryptomeria japonica]
MKSYAAAGNLATEVAARTPPESTVTSPLEKMLRRVRVFTLVVKLHPQYYDCNYEKLHPQYYDCNLCKLPARFLSQCQGLYDKGCVARVFIGVILDAF